MEECDLPEAPVAEKRIELVMLERLDADQKALASKVDSIETRISSLGREISEIRGALKPRPEAAWWLRFIVAPVCVASILGTAGAVIHLEIRVSNIEAFVRDNGGFIAGLRLRQAASDPTDLQNIKNAESVITQAESAKIHIPADVVGSAGQKFVDASKNAPEAWNVALLLAQYRTRLNADALPFLPDLRDSRGYDAYLKIWPPGSEGSAGQLTSMPADTCLVGHAPQDTAARVEPLEKPNPKSSDAQFIVFDWRRSEVLVGLDGMRLRNVIIRNARIRYDGGPTDLRNVYFVNCTFAWTRRTLPGQEFAKALFEAPSVTFETAVPATRS